MRHPLKFALVVLSILATPLAACSAEGTKSEVFVADDGLAAGGYDVVAYFTKHQPERGSADHQFEYRGANWRFASAENLNRFKADPSAYAPQFGGHCAWAASQAYIAPGDPRQWKIVEGKLYLNFNTRAKQLWEANQDEAIKQGHRNSPELMAKGSASQ